jgi:hypothetical protein
MLLPLECWPERARNSTRPENFPSYPACWRQLGERIKSATFQKVWASLLNRLDRLNEVDWDVDAADATFVLTNKCDIVMLSSGEFLSRVSLVIERSRFISLADK